MVVIFSIAPGTKYVCESNSCKINPTADLRLLASCTEACTNVAYEWEIDYHNGSQYLPLNDWGIYATGNILKTIL